ncbi:duodenase-1-like [Pyxicephalus adspersus]|uniref:duodenase-1-like n=1 Tax=Pyxicephalus adspersus TaxID=30357 RepID=UPI003B5AB027
MKLFLVLDLFVLHLLSSDAGRIKIINGNETNPHSRPYMALIKYGTRFGDVICGGSLIHESWVLTAGHCRMLGSVTTIILGAHAKDKNEKEQQVFRFPRDYTHPRYDESCFCNDLKLYKTAPSFNPKTFHAYFSYLKQQNWEMLLKFYLCHKHLQT